MTALNQPVARHALILAALVAKAGIGPRNASSNTSQSTAAITNTRAAYARDAAEPEPPAFFLLKVIIRVAPFATRKSETAPLGGNLKLCDNLSLDAAHSRFTSLSGTQVIASNTSSTAEPCTLALLGAGMLLRFRKARSRDSRKSR